LICDELGYVSFRRNGVELLFFLVLPDFSASNDQVE